jgi:hypothetical protein
MSTGTGSSHTHCLKLVLIIQLLKMYGEKGVKTFTVLKVFQCSGAAGSVLAVIGLPQIRIWITTFLEVLSENQNVDCSYYGNK